jgi:hypothetical protein
VPRDYTGIVKCQFDAETYDRLKKIAEADGRSLKNFAERAILSAAGLLPQTAPKPPDTK